MIKSNGRIPLRPLGKVLAARQRGESTDAIEQENTRQRNHEIDSREHIKAKGRLVVLAAVFFLSLWRVGRSDGAPGSL
jgi:cell division protein FtsI (penicillin-binding protein 3)